MPDTAYDTQAVCNALGRLLEHEMAGVVRYTHYSFMVFGFSRIPIVGWLRSAATEGLTHAQQVGEMITTLGGQPPLGIGRLLDNTQLDIGGILRQSLAFEKQAIQLYGELLTLVEGKSVMLEEFARTMIADEQMHYAEIDKMLRTPGSSQPVELP